MTLTQEWMDAVKAGDVKAAGAALEKGVDVNAYESGRTALSTAAQNGDVDMIDFLVEHGANLELSETTGCGPLHVATMFGKKDAVLRLIELGANVNAPAVSGATPLLIAVSHPAPDLVKMLLEHGGDIEATDKDGETALIKAINFHRDETLCYLLERGANVNACDRSGYSVLHKAIIVDSGDGWRTDVLLDFGPDMNALDGCGRTPLMLAVQGGKSLVARQLLARGADTTIRDKEGLTALDMAEAQGDAALAGDIKNARIEQIRSHTAAQQKALKVRASRPKIRMGGA